MEQKGQAFLKALLVSIHHQAELLHFLPAELEESLENIKTPSSFEPKKLFTKKLDNIHFSWFAQILSSYPQAIQLLFTGALDIAQAKAVEKMLSLASISSKLSLFAKRFLTYVLDKELKNNEIIDSALLEESELSELLRISRSQLLLIIDSLGLYDLAADMRQIIDKELLKKVESALTRQQHHFLHYCIRQPMRWMPPKLPLTSWDGTAGQLNHWLHQRGLIRLSKAINETDPSFKWHVLHKLDTGRAKVVQKELYQKQLPGLTHYFYNQLLDVLKKVSGIGS